MSGINDRIKSKLDRNKGITQAAIARYCGVSTSALSNPKHFHSATAPLRAVFYLAKFIFFDLS